MEASDIAEWQNQKLYDALKKRGVKTGPVVPSTKLLYANLLARLIKKEPLAEDQVKNDSKYLTVESQKTTSPKITSEKVGTISKVPPTIKKVVVVRDKMESRNKTYKPFYTSSFCSPEKLFSGVKARRPLPSSVKAETEKAREETEKAREETVFLPRRNKQSPWYFRNDLIFISIGVVVLFLVLYLLMEPNPSKLNLG